LEPPSRRSLELNEALWWSNWARLTWFGSTGYLLTSEELREPFFNRACSLTCTGIGRLAGWAEKKFAAVGLYPTIMVFDPCARSATVLEASGYKSVDAMAVLLSKSPIIADIPSKATVTLESSADRWTRAYLEAFYGDRTLAPVVAPTVNRLTRARAATLLEARISGGTAGVLALFRTKGLAGVYCVGTVPRYRRQGIAAMLLARARAIAEAEGRWLVLQSLASDGTQRYYLERGFTALYSKRMLSKENSNALQKKQA